MGGFLDFIAPIAGGLIEGLGSYFTADAAADAQRDASRRQIDQQNAVLERILGIIQPQVEAGDRARAALAFESGIAPRPGGYEGFQKAGDYQFGLDEGRKLIESRGSALGNLFSGATGERLMKFGQDYASQRRNSYLNRLASLANAGQVATGTGASAMASTGGNVFNALGSIGAAGANRANQIGSGIAGGLNTAAQLYGLLRY